MFSPTKLAKQDILLALLTFVLSVIGLLTVFTTTFFPEKQPSEDFKQQLLFFLVGLVIYLVLTSLDPSYLRVPHVQLVIYVLTLFLLVVLLASDSSGPRRWLELGEFSVQPSEFAKLTVVLLTAFVWGRELPVRLGRVAPVKKDVPLPSRTRKLLNPTLINLLANTILVIPIILLIWLQPSLGNAVITLGIFLILLSTLLKSSYSLYLWAGALILGASFSFDLVTFLGISIGIPFASIVISTVGFLVVLSVAKIAREKLWLIIAIFIIGLAGGLATRLAWDNLLTDYQRDRVVAFVNPNEDPLGTHWQVNQAKIAIASGQIFGKGLLQGTQTNYNLLPYAYTDFAYAAFAEQFGFIGSLLLLGILYLLISRILAIAKSSYYIFDRLLVSGVAIMLAVNTFINVGMNLGILPVTGVPLPLVSYGGSAVLANLIGIGLVQMVYTKQQHGGPHVERVAGVL